MVQSGRQSALRHLDVIELCPASFEQRGDLGALEGDRAALGVVLVVAGGVVRALDDLLEVAVQRRYAPQDTPALLLERACELASA